MQAEDKMLVNRVKIFSTILILLQIIYDEIDRQELQKRESKFYR